MHTSFEYGRACRSRMALVTATLLMVIAVVGADQSGDRSSGSAASDYVVGPQDVLTITSYDQADLSGKFTVETDGTFTFPLVGRFKAGGLTLRQVEGELRRRLTADGFFKNPQITIAVETYKSQKVSVVGEVRQPGTYPLSGSMTLIEALARAGSTLSSASGEAIIVRASGDTSATQSDGPSLTRIELRDLENGLLSQNASLRDGDTIFVPRAESIYVSGQVRTPGAYLLQQRNTTVLQALSLAGGVNDRGATGRIRVIRIAGSATKEFRVSLNDIVQPGDTIVVPERFF